MFKASSNQQIKMNTLHTRLKETLDIMKNQTPGEWNEWMTFMCDEAFPNQLNIAPNAPPTVKLIGNLLTHPEIVFGNMTPAFKQEVITEIKRILHDANNLEQNAYVAPTVMR